MTLDHAYVHGGVFFTGSGAVSVSNSIIEGGSGSEWYVFYDAASSSSARMTFTDSTVRWQAGKTFPSGYDVGPIWQRSDESMDVERCDISGLPQGLDPAGGSIVKNNWIHGLVQNSTSSSPTHLDGIFSQGGSNITISGNYVDVPLRIPSDVTAAVFFQDIPYAPVSNIVVSSNYLYGGSFTLRNESVSGLTVTNNVFAGGAYGPLATITPASIGTWTGNINLKGASVRPS